MIGYAFLFIIFLLFFIVIPFYAFLSYFRVKISNDSCINISLSLAAGVILFTLICIVIRLFNLSFSVLWLNAVISFFYVLYKRKNIVNSLFHFRNKIAKKVYFLSFAVILIGIVAQNIVMFRGGWYTDDGIIFPSLDDNMWNISFIVELSKSFPPQHPAMAGQMLKNNHYLYQFFLAAIYRIMHIDLLDLYFRLAPVLVSFLFGSSIYAVASIFVRRNIFHAMIVFLGIFSGNIAYIVPIFLGKEFDWKGNTFFSDQPFDQIINPYSILGFSFFLFSIFTLSQIPIGSNKQKIFWSVLSALFIGSLYGFKSFGGIVALIAFTVVVMILLFKRMLYIILPFILSFIIFIPIFFLMTEPTIVGLRWSPGWVLTEMMVGKDKLNLPHFAQIESYYLMSKNSAGLIKIKLIEFIIYTVGNFGIRIIGVGYLFYLIFHMQSKPKAYQFIIWYMTAACIVAFMIPLLFNLGSNAHNIVQFTPYALIIAAVATGIALALFYESPHQLKHKYLPVAVIISISLLATVVNGKNILTKLPSPQNNISSDEWETLQYIREHSIDTDIILIDPRQYRVNPIYISALSQRRLYVATSGNSIQTGRDPYPRLNETYQFFDRKLEDEMEFLKLNKIAYIYLLNPHPYKEIENILPSYISLVFDNKRNTIYKVKLQ